LQRTAGNAVVARLLSGTAVASPRRSVVQRNKEDRFTFRGGSKWREIIDEQHHTSGPLAYEDREPGFYENMLLADDFTRRTLGGEISAEGYQQIHDLAIRHNPTKAGWRSGGIEWGLTGRDQTPDAQLVENLKGHGLSVRAESAREGGRHMVTVPEASPEEVQNQVERIFDNYYLARAEIRTKVQKGEDRTNAMVRLIAGVYQQLEVLHAFKDGTSRTNHLVLNKLLVENGMYPVTLIAPNSPQFTREEWVGSLRASLKSTERDVKGGREPIHPQAKDQAIVVGTAAMVGHVPFGFLDPKMSVKLPPRPTSRRADLSGGIANPSMSTASPITTTTIPSATLAVGSDVQQIATKINAAHEEPGEVYGLNRNDWAFLGADDDNWFDVMDALLAFGWTNSLL
jgi:hypothetical protein